MECCHQSQIQSYRSALPNGDEEGLVGFWNFNDGEGTLLTDLSGNGNHGSVVGAEWSIDAPELDSSEPSISISPESYDFGQVIYGDTLETVFTIYNNRLSSSI